jgi:hypothetical protein
MEKAYLRAQLSLSIPSMSSPYISALIYEAGVFAGFESRRDRYNRMSRSGGPFQTFQAVSSLLSIVVEVITQLYLLLGTISSNYTVLNTSTVILIVLSLAPTGLRLAASWFAESMRNRKNGSTKDWRKQRRDEMDIRDMGRKGEYKQEVVLFGLKDWVLGKWDDVKIAQMKEQENATETVGYVELWLGLGQHSIETAFYVSFHCA